MSKFLSLLAPAAPAESKSTANSIAQNEAAGQNEAQNPAQNAPQNLHVAIIMDGNGRWAAQRGKPRPFGHEAGARALLDLIAHAAGCEQIAQLSVFAFSTENWRRPKAEISALFALLRRFLDRAQEDFLREQIAFFPFGDLEPLAEKEDLKRLQERTQNGGRLRFNLGINYGAANEIARAAAALAATGAAINEASLFGALDLPQPVDLLIRTGNRARLSNFLLLQSAYAHIHFSPALFPDFSPALLDAAIAEFAATPRTFGGI